MRRPIHVMLSLVLIAACGDTRQTLHRPVPPEAVEPAPEPGPPPLPFASDHWRDVLPGGAQGVAGAHLPVLLESELVGFGLALTGAEGQLEALRQAAASCGMAFPEDVHTVVVAWYAGERVAAVSKGRFDQARAEACLGALAARGGVVVETDEIAGRTAFAGAGQGQRFWLMVPEEGLALVTSTRALMEEILAAGTPRMAAAQDELAAWLERVPQQHALWGAGQVPPGSEMATTVMSLVGDRISAPMSGIYGFADPASGLSSEVYLVMHDKGDADALVGRVKEQLSFIRPGLMLQGLTFLLDRVTFSTSGSLVQIRIALTPEQLARVRAKLAPGAPSR